MSEQTSIDGPSPWTERASGPPARWYVYVAAIICATFFSSTATSVFHGFLDGFLLREGGSLAQPLGWYGLVTGCASGLIWGTIFSWARQLRLVIVVPILALFSALSLGAAVYELVSVSGERAAELDVLRAAALSTALHVATFWLVFLTIAIRSRREGRRAA